jgi:hypothetical protein
LVECIGNERGGASGDASAVSQARRGIHPGPADCERRAATQRSAAASQGDDVRLATALRRAFGKK